jgi:hypothetical protein
MAFGALALASAFGGGILNFLSGRDVAKQREEAIRTFQESMGEQLLSEEDIRQRQRDIGRTFNTNIQNLLNTTALSTRDAANAPVISAAAIAPVVGQAATAQAGIREDSLAFNKQIRNMIAQAGLNMPESDPIGDFFGGMIQGGIAGAQISELIDTEEDITANIKPTVMPEVAKMDSMLSPKIQETLGNIPSGKVGADFFGNKTGKVDIPYIEAFKEGRPFGTQPASKGFTGGIGRLQDKFDIEDYINF